MYIEGIDHQSQDYLTNILKKVIFIIRSIKHFTQHSTKTQTIKKLPSTHKLHTSTKHKTIKHLHKSRFLHYNKTTQAYRNKRHSPRKVEHFSRRYVQYGRPPVRAILQHITHKFKSLGPARIIIGHNNRFRDRLIQWLRIVRYCCDRAQCRSLYLIGRCVKLSVCV